MVGTEILIILVLILANGFFAAAEIAMVSARRGRLEQQAESGRGAARQALTLTAHPERFLATVGVGIELIGTFTAAFGGDQLGEQLTLALGGIPMLATQDELRKTLALILVVLPLTFMTMLLGELVPKRLALRNAEGFAIFSAPVMTVMTRVVHPAVAVLTAAANGILRLLRQSGPAETPVTEEDIVYLAREGTASGTVEPAEAQFIRRVFQFTDRPVRMVMTPRPAIVAVEVATPLQEVINTFLRVGHARLPVYEESLDRVLGILHSKDLLRAMQDQPAPDLRPLLHPPVFVLEHQPVDEVLATFRKQSTQLALVLDEYGLVSGLVSITDLLEELVGELPGESPTPGDAPIFQRDENSWLVDGQEAYDTVCERISVPDIPEAERHGYNTVAGLVLARLGRLPAVGDTVDIGDYVFEVVDLDGRRIDRLLIRRRDPDEKGTPAPPSPQQ